MSEILAYVIAGICASAYIILWFISSYRMLKYHYYELMATKEQMQMHQSLYLQERGGSNMQSAKRMLDTSRMIYQESKKAYNRVYSNPFYRIPGYILGFRPVNDEEE